MQIFNRSKPRDVLFLMPVHLRGEKLSRSKIRILYCDVEGRIYAAPVSRSAYESAIAGASNTQNRPFATVGLETTPGNFAPAVVEINERELWALEHITHHALKTGRLPDILKKHLKSIIRSGAARREAVIAEYQKNCRKPRSSSMPKVLDRLPYYREHDMEISLPVYKAEHSYPLIILKFLSDTNESKKLRNILVLDSDGDLAKIQIPARLLSGVEKKLDAPYSSGKKGITYAVIHQLPRGKKVDYMMISPAQKNALDTITRYYEATGNSRQGVPVAVRNLISMAEKRAAPEAHTGT